MRRLPPSSANLLFPLHQVSTSFIHALVLPSSYKLSVGMLRALSSCSSSSSTVPAVAMSQVEGTTCHFIMDNAAETIAHQAAQLLDTSSSSTTTAAPTLEMINNSNSIASSPLVISPSSSPSPSSVDDNNNNNKTSDQEQVHEHVHDLLSKDSPQENPDHHLNWNPFSNRVASLRSLHQMGIGRDPNNEYRVCIRDTTLVVKWARKVLNESQKTKNSLKKWEKAMLPRLLTGCRKKEASTSSSADNEQRQQSPDLVTNEQLVQRTQQFLDDAFAEATRGDSNKLKRAPEPGTLTYDELNEEQQKVVQLASTGRCLFIGGTAGTGKTALLRALHAHFVSKLGLKVGLCATTGVAGVHVGGSTFHSTVGVPCAPGAPWDVQMLRAVDAIIIDEVSMLTSVLLEALDIAAKEARLSAQPFGGIQVILCGDFMQLVPEDKLLFESPIFAALVKVGLRTALRHKEGEFRDALLALRVGKFHDTFKKCFVDELPNPLETDATFLFPRRISAQQVNDLRLQHIRVASAGDERIYLPQRGVMSLCGNFSSACIVSFTNLAHHHNNSSSSSSSSSQFPNFFSSRRICEAVQEALNVQNSAVFSMTSRSGLSPQVVFRLKHPSIVGAKPEVSEEQWRGAVQNVLSASSSASYVTWHFEEGDCSDIIPLDVATALGSTTNASTMNIGGDNNNTSNNINFNINNIANQQGGVGSVVSSSVFWNGNASGQSSQQQQQQHQQPVRLRLGCRVMINRNLSKDVVNGSVGEVVRFEEPNPEKFPFAHNPTLMRLWYQKGGKQAVQNYGVLPVVQLIGTNNNNNNNAVVEVEPSTSSSSYCSASHDTDINSHVVPSRLPQQQQQQQQQEYQIPPMFVSVGGGEETSYYQQSSFYLPLQLGYAATIHKVQGLTLSGRVVLDLREMSYNCPHLVYVALSRVRTLEQLSIVGLKPKKHITVDRRALDFSSSLKSVDEVLRELADHGESTSNEGQNSTMTSNSKVLYNEPSDWIIKRKSSKKL